jgi:hypothetical protein
MQKSLQRTYNPNNCHGQTWSFTLVCPQQSMKVSVWFYKDFHINSHGLTWFFTQAQPAMKVETPLEVTESFL